MRRVVLQLRRSVDKYRAAVQWVQDFSTGVNDKVAILAPSKGHLFILKKILDSLHISNVLYTSRRLTPGNPFPLENAINDLSGVSCHYFYNSFFLIKNGNS